MPPKQILLSESDYLRFSELVRAKSGLEISEPRRPDLERAVLNALTQMGLPDTHALYQHLISSDGHPALEALLAALTIGETHFFRNRPQFEALEQHILPDLIAQRRNVRRLRLWSAGCASGEEAYSLAILLDRLLPDRAQWNILILATDINRQALEKARQGVYSQWSFREVPPEIQSTYFTSHTSSRTQSPTLEVAPRLRALVTLEYLNLAEDIYPSLLTNTHAIDLILCRNVFIYFRETVIRRVVGRMYEALVEGGWLIVGHAEPSQAIFHHFTTHNFPGTVIYQKTAGSKQSGVDAAQSRNEGSKVKRTFGDHAPAALDTPFPLPNPTPFTNPFNDITPPTSKRSTPEPPTKAQPVMPATAPTPLPYQSALTLWEAGQTAEAQRQLETVTAADVPDTHATYLIAKIHANNLQLESAEDWIKVTLERSPLMAAAHYLHSLILLEGGRPNEALAALRRCIYTDPQYVLGHFALAGLLARQGQEHRAQKAFENVTQLLASRPPDELIVDGEGLTVGRLLELVAAQRKL